MVEAAFALSVFFVLTFGMLDLGLAVLSNHIVQHAARQAARIASVHGAKAPPTQNTWGPTTLVFTANASSEQATAIAPFLAGLDLTQTTVTLIWPDGNTNLGSRVTVTVATRRSPSVGLVFSGNWNLSATSEMLIAH